MEAAANSAGESPDSFVTHSEQCSKSTSELLKNGRHTSDRQYKKKFLRFEVWIVAVNLLLLK